MCGRFVLSTNNARDPRIDPCVIPNCMYLPAGVMLQLLIKVEIILSVVTMMMIICISSYTHSQLKEDLSPSPINIRRFILEGCSARLLHHFQSIFYYTSDSVTEICVA